MLRSTSSDDRPAPPAGAPPATAATRRVRCGCGVKLRLKATAARFRCPSCGKAYTIRPKSEAAPPAAPAQTQVPPPKVSPLEVEQLTARAATGSAAVSTARRIAINAPAGAVSAAATAPAAVETRPKAVAPHALAREAIASTLSRDPSSPTAASRAMARAAHPWPDGVDDPAVLAAVAAELLPAANLPSFDAAAVAEDRLLRLAEAMTHAGRPDLAADFRDAAGELAGAPPQPETRRDAVLRSPWGRGVPNVEPPDESTDSGDHPPSDAVTVFVDRLFGLTAAGGKTAALLGDNAKDRVDEIARSSRVEHPVGRFSHAASAMDDRGVAISEDRAGRDVPWDEPHRTLEDHADDWDVSRERIRQIEKTGSAALAEQSPDLTALAEGLLSEYRGRLTAVDAFRQRVRSAVKDCDIPRLAAAAICEPGDWRCEGDWVSDAETIERIAAAKANLTDGADGDGAVSADAVAGELAGLLPDADCAARLAEQTWGWTRFDESTWLTRDVQTVRVSLALKALGRPGTKEEIGELAGLDPRQVSGAINNLGDRVCRATKDAWDFADRVDDEYDGVVGEIEQRIDENGGEVPRALLLEEIPERFGVSVSSVEAYIKSPVFETDGAFVRRAETDDFHPGPPRPDKGAVLVGDLWGQKVEVKEWHLPGGRASLAADFAVAHANGLRPRDGFRVPVRRTAGGNDCPNAEASIIYRLGTSNGSAYIGRAREFLAAEGFVAGDEIVVVPTPEFVVIARYEDADRAATDQTMTTDAAATRSAMALPGL